MYHSIILENPKTGEKINTYDDWFLAPTSRPVINPPTPKTNYVDIPGSSGAIDMSETLTGYPVYENREGSFTFYVLNALNDIPDPQLWNVRYERILNFVHGKTLKLILEDDPAYYYIGRLKVDKWDSKANNSEIEISYNLEPYKWKIESTIDDWIWDSFNFDTDTIEDGYKDIIVNSPNAFKAFTFNKENELQAPVIPIFRVSSMTQSMTIEFINTALGIDVTYPLALGDNEFFDCVITNISDWVLKVKGKGTISIVYNKGRL